MSALFQRTKVAAIREPDYPVGVAAPCYLRCPCGAKPRAYAGDVTCACGTTYTEDGWIVSRQGDAHEQARV